MLHCLLCCDKFKGTLSASEANESISAAFNPSISYISVPLSDGGEGFVGFFKSLLCDIGKVYQDVSERVTGPNGKLVDAEFIVYEENGRKTAIIEMALCSGLALIPKEEQNPMNTTSKGTGELIKIAYVKYGCTNILLGIGGSATTDSGLGALQALGVNIFINNECLLDNFVGKMLKDVQRLEISNDSLFNKVHIKIACDVTAPLCGPTGSAKIFAAQKGASEEEIEYLEAGMLHVSKLLPIDVLNLPGAGAAGGICGGLKSFFGAKAELVLGSDMVFDLINMRDKIEKSDIVFTGEGKVDKSTFQGKVVSKVIELCKSYNKKCIIVCGAIDLESSSIKALDDSTPNIFQFDKDIIIAPISKSFPLHECVSEPKACIQKLMKKLMIIINKQFI